jgi:SNF2 family DNA or RNA helicase
VIPRPRFIISLIEANTDKASKLDVLKDLLKPIIASGEKAIIFTQFAQMLHILATELEEFRPLTIYGDVDNLDRMERVKEFNDDPKGRVIIMTEAGAYGLNMQSASYVIHYDAPWSVAKLEQREGRAHRIGQKKSVTVYNLIAKKTIDEYVLKVLHAKQKISAKILGDVERMESGGMSLEDINNILRL